MESKMHAHDARLAPTRSASQVPAVTNQFTARLLLIELPGLRVFVDVSGIFPHHPPLLRCPRHVLGRTRCSQPPCRNATSVLPVTYAIAGSSPPRPCIWCTSGTAYAIHFLVRRLFSYTNFSLPTLDPQGAFNEISGLAPFCCEIPEGPRQSGALLVGFVQWNVTAPVPKKLVTLREYVEMEVFEYKGLLLPAGSPERLASHSDIHGLFSGAPPTSAETPDLALIKKIRPACFSAEHI
jgi:hypothetical protein